MASLSVHNNVAPPRSQDELAGQLLKHPGIGVGKNRSPFGVAVINIQRDRPVFFKLDTGGRRKHRSCITQARNAVCLLQIKPCNEAVAHRLALHEGNENLF